MVSMILLLALPVFCVVSAGVPTCVQGPSPDMRADDNDCSVYHVCSNGRLYRFQCPDSVFNPIRKICVLKGSQYDTCTGRTTDRKPLPCNQGSRAVIPHPKHCGQYYNCSAPAQRSWWEDHLWECPYPQVFNADTKRCEHFSMVRCKSRVEPLSACDYKMNRCSRSAHCIPCWVLHPSCKNLPNGLNPWVGKEGSPYFAICLNQRVVYSGTCSREFGRPIFDPVSKMCVSPKDQQH